MAYISRTELLDRDIYKRGEVPEKAGSNDSRRLIFRNLMIDEEDLKIADVIWNYFDAVRERWPRAWSLDSRGLMLNKTNGFKGLMRFLGYAYLSCVSPGGVPSKDEFLEIFNRVALDDDYFNTENYKPGSSGESQLFRDLKDATGIDAV